MVQASSRAPIIGTATGFPTGRSLSRATRRTRSPFEPLFRRACNTKLTPGMPTTEAHRVPRQPLIHFNRVRRRIWPPLTSINQPTSMLQGTFQSEERIFDRHCSANLCDFAHLSHQLARHEGDAARTSVGTSASRAAFYRARLGMAQIQARRASEWIGPFLVHSLARRACINVAILAVFRIAPGLVRCSSMSPGADAHRLAEESPGGTWLACVTAWHDFSGVSRRRQPNEKNEKPFNAARGYSPCCGYRSFLWR